MNTVLGYLRKSGRIETDLTEVLRNARGCETVVLDNKGNAHAGTGR